VRRTVPPSAEIEAQIDQLLAVGVGENPREALSELASVPIRICLGPHGRALQAGGRLFEPNTAHPEGPAF
jgi:hypothetical protein